MGEIPGGGKISSVGDAKSGMQVGGIKSCWEEKLFQGQIINLLLVDMQQNSEEKLEVLRIHQEWFVSETFWQWTKSIVWILCPLISSGKLKWFHECGCSKTYLLFYTLKFLITCQLAKNISGNHRDISYSWCFKRLINLSQLTMFIWRTAFTMISI